MPSAVQQAFADPFAGDSPLVSLPSVSDRRENRLDSLTHVPQNTAGSTQQVAMLQPEPEELKDLKEAQPEEDRTKPLPEESEPQELPPTTYVPQRPQMDSCSRQGLRYLKCGFPIAALDTLLCSQSANQDIKYGKELTIGAAFGSLELLEEARCHYCRAARCSSDPSVRRKAKQYLCDLDRYMNCRELWRGGLSVTVLYDSEPGVLPLFNAVGIPQAADDTVGNSYTFYLERDLTRGDNYELAAGFGAYGAENYSAHEFDIGNYNGYLRYKRRGYWCCTPTYFGLLANYDYMTVGDQSFLSNPTVSPSVTFLHDDRRSTVIYGDYRYYDFLGQGALDGTPLDLDSNYGRVGISRCRRFGPCRNLLVSGGYQFAGNGCEGSDYDYTTHNIVGYVLWEVPRSKALVRLGGEYHIRDYSNVNSIAAVTRSDREGVVVGSILYPLLDDFFLTLDVTYDDNDSNLVFNEYNRTTIHLGLEYRFPMSWATRSRRFDRF